MRREWHHWVQNAPNSWKDDGFITENVPVALTMRYGQNQMLDTDTAADWERNNWNRDRDLQHIRTLSLSIAHHILFVSRRIASPLRSMLNSHPRFHKVSHWRRASDDDLLRRHPVLYDLPVTDPDRRQIDIHGYPRRDDRNRIQHVYNREGFKVHRRYPAQNSTVASGALVDLTKVDVLFPNSEDGRVTYDTYPLGYTKIYGNVQSKHTIAPFEWVLQEANIALTPPIDPDDDDDMDDFARGAPVLRGTHCQIYNVISHRVRDHARFHLVQLGMVTSVFAGTFAESEPHKRRFLHRKSLCEAALPHERHERALASEDQPQATRLEQTYTLDVYRLSQEHRNGA